VVFLTSICHVRGAASGGEPLAEAMDPVEVLLLLSRRTGARRGRPWRSRRSWPTRARPQHKPGPGRRGARAARHAEPRRQGRHLRAQTLTRRLSTPVTCPVAWHCGEASWDWFVEASERTTTHAGKLASLAVLCSSSPLYSYFLPVL
jgi:hypothetical protein